MIYKKEDWAYLAGIIDGEGWIGVRRIKDRSGRSSYPYHYVPELSVSNTDERIIKWIRNIFQVGCIDCWHNKKNPHRKPVYKWRISRKVELSFVLENTLPFLIIKKEQALIIMKLRLLMDKTKPCPGNPLTKSAREQREYCYNELKRLNKRGGYNS